MMKKTIALLLAICLLFGSTAMANTRPRLKVQSTSPFEDRYFKENGIRVALPNYGWDSPLTYMTGGDPPDMIALCTIGDDLEQIKASGLVADLSGSEIIRRFTDQLRPEIKALVTTEKGEIFGVPIRAFLNPMAWNQEGWDAAGLTEADVPASYVALLDFLEAWSKRTAEQPQKKIIVVNNQLWYYGRDDYSYTYWLMDVLIRCWEMQAVHAGEAVTFDTPEFIALAQRAREVGSMLYETEPRGKKRERMLPLFDAEVNIFDSGKDYRISRYLPYRITDDQPELMMAWCDVNYIYKDSPWKDELVTCYEQELLAMASNACLYSELYINAQPGSFQLYPDSDERAEITAGYLAERNAYAGTVVFPVHMFYQHEGTLLKYSRGQLSAEDMAAAISKIKRNPND